jgi:hypothetical protein
MLNLIMCIITHVTPTQVKIRHHSIVRRKAREDGSSFPTPPRDKKK